MIPENFIEQWSINARWQTLDQVEQDLIISRALVCLYNDAFIKDRLVFRGGTALNKVYIDPAARFSEDLDFVQKCEEPITAIVDKIRSILESWLGTPKWKITESSAKLFYRYESVNKLPMKLKIEINLTEQFQVLDLIEKEFSVNSPWFSGKASLITYEMDELMATKLRALYQRRKGRDLFDIWYVYTNNLIEVNRMLDIFQKYCAKDNIYISRKNFVENMLYKRQHKDFNIDMSVLLHNNNHWEFNEAFDFVMNEIINKLPE